MPIPTPNADPAPGLAYLVVDPDQLPPYSAGRDENANGSGASKPSHYLHEKPYLTGVTVATLRTS